ncbi:MAG: hypothetical protein KC419_21245 [Anaerolineales bacterium]|nr:hypothetical protein [Anaerolineales bacterium]
MKNILLWSLTAVFVLYGAQTIALGFGASQVAADFIGAGATVILVVFPKLSFKQSKKEQEAQ